MANYRAIIRQFPAAREYLKQAKWIRRGDVLAYWPRVSNDVFSTDEFGFRHTWFDGRNIGLGDVGRHERVGLVFGSSHVFGFGLSHNRETLPSRLSAILGYPYFGVSYPEADTRTLYSTFIRLARQHGDRIERVVLITGGDFTRYCYLEQADPMFGSPMLPQDARLAPIAPEERHFANLVAFTDFWSEGFAEAADRAGIAFCMLDDVTFFEKSAPDKIETACELGMTSDDGLRRRFDAHHRRALAYQGERRRIASERGFALASLPANELLFIDEFHYRAETQDLIARILADQIS